VESGESDAEEMNMKLKDHPTLFDMTPEVHAPTREEIAAACEGPGGFTKRRLASWGVGWPPPHGWRAKLEQAADERECRIPVVAAGHDYERFQYFYYKRGER